MKIWQCESSPLSGSWNAWTRIKNVYGASRLEQLLEFLGARSKWFPIGRDWWPWTKPGYITMTQRQSNNQWSGGIATHSSPPQKFRVQKSARKVLTCLDFLGSRRHPPDWSFSKGPNYQREVLLISSGAIEGHLEGKTPLGGKVTKGVLLAHDNAPVDRALATQKKMAYLGFQCLDHPHSSPDLGQPDYHLFPGLKEKQLNIRHFWSDVEVIAVAETWLDGQLSDFFLSGLQKLEQGANRFIELRGEYF